MGFQNKLRMLQRDQQYNSVYFSFYFLFLENLYIKKRSFLEMLLMIFSIKKKIITDQKIFYIS